MVSTSRPSKVAEPLMSAPGLRPSRLRAVTLLPDPVSPTIPRVCPASTSKDSPRTALTTPSEVGKETVRFSTASRLTAEKGTAVSARRVLPGGHRHHLALSAQLSQIWSISYCAEKGQKIAL